MHPPEFVETKISQGRADELVDMLGEFLTRIRSTKTSATAEVHGIVHMLVMSIVCELDEIKPGQSLDQFPFLRAWRRMGLFGLDREVISRKVSEM